MHPDITVMVDWALKSNNQSINVHIYYQGCFTVQVVVVLQQYTGLRFADDRTLFARLVMKLTDLRNINEVHSKMLMKMKVDDIEPLLLEIFDL